VLNLTEALGLASMPVLRSEGGIAPGATVQLAGQNLASELGGSGLQWDETARAVRFTYNGAGGEHTVWLTNRFSEAFKLDLARRQQLGGIAIEDVALASEDSDIWPAVLQYAGESDVALARPNGELLQPRWAATSGALEADIGAVVTWIAPQEAGSYTVTLIVSDGVRRVGQELQVPVQAPAGGRAP
jgi:hypothetical protein